LVKLIAIQKTESQMQVDITYQFIYTVTD